MMVIASFIFFGSVWMAFALGFLLGSGDLFGEFKGEPERLEIGDGS